MQESDKIQVYDNQPIRTAWDEQNEEWYFSIVDVVSVLTDQPDRRRAGKYWSVLKTRLKKEGSQLPTNCSQLKLKADDGKRYKTDVANTEQLLRIIQSIPSKKAEPFKLWLAQIGRERIEETIDPELTIDRALDTYSKKGYPADWINQRLQTIRARKELTDQWQTHGVEKGKEYAILTDEVTRAWSGMNTRQYKNLKGLGRRLDLERIHPHKFRRTMATRAIDKGMPIEQVQKILGHSQIDTTMQYAMVNQNNVKSSHQKYMS